MWYKFAKQGSLWSIVSPAFEQDVDKAINASIVSKDFTKEDVEKYPDYIREGSFRIVDFNLFEENFKNIPNNKLGDYKFRYKDFSNESVKGGAYCDSRTKSIIFDEKTIQQLSWVRSSLKHEITHAIEYLIPNREKELYSNPEEHQSNLFKDYLPNQKPLGLKEMLQKLEDKFYDQIVLQDVEITVVDARKKAKLMAEKTLRELQKRSKSIQGKFDLYMANPSELRAFRAEIDNFFSVENLINTFEAFYGYRENGKSIFLEQLYNLIQMIVNIKDVEENYKQSELYQNLNNIVQDSSFDSRFNLQVINNLDPQYIGQIAKYLSNIYIDFKSYLSSYVPNISDTELIK
jgi:hypothetical protein